MAHAAHAIALYVQLRLYSSSRADQAIELARATQEREKERGNMSDTRRGREKREATRGRKRRERPGERKRGSKREGGGSEMHHKTAWGARAVPELCSMHV